MKYYFLFLIFLVLIFSSCATIPPTGGPGCYTDEDCSDYSGDFICNANGDCEACPLPSCVAPPENCIYEPDDSSRCPTCGTLKCDEPTEPILGSGTTYYVSIYGDDANSGTSKDTPLKTLDAVSSLMLEPGDNVLFKRGETFQGTLLINNQDGTADNRITFSAYGEGEKPIITAKDELPEWQDRKNWEDQGNNVWLIRFEKELPITVNRLWLDGKEYCRAWEKDKIYDMDRGQKGELLDFKDSVKPGEWSNTPTEEFRFLRKSVRWLSIYSEGNPVDYYESLAWSGTERLTMQIILSDYITIDNLDIQGGWWKSLHVEGSSHMIIQNSNIGKDGLGGFSYFSHTNTDTPATNLEVKSNVFDSGYNMYCPNRYYTSAGAALFAYDVSDIKVHNNHFQDWSSVAIKFYGTTLMAAKGARNAHVYDNTIDNSGQRYGVPFNFWAANFGDCADVKPSLCDSATTEIKLERAKLQCNCNPKFTYPDVDANINNIYVYNNYITNSSKRTQMAGRNIYFHHNVWENVGARTKDTRVMHHDHVNNGYGQWEKIDVISQGMWLMSQGSRTDGNIHIFNNVFKDISSVGLRDGGFSNGFYANNLFINAGKRYDDIKIYKDGEVDKEWHFSMDFYKTNRNSKIKNNYIYIDRNVMNSHNDEFISYGRIKDGILDFGSNPDYPMTVPEFNSLNGQYGDEISENQLIEGPLSNYVDENLVPVQGRDIILIDAGTDISEYMTHVPNFRDMNGNLVDVNNPDVGAFEHMS